MKSPGDCLFDISLELSSSNPERGYLGEYYTMKAILLASAARVLNAGTKEDPDDEIKKSATKIAFALLGRPTPAFPCPVPGWHAPGIADEFLAKTLNLEEEDPFKRCHLVALRLFNEIQSTPNFKEDFEAWKEGIDTVINKYTDLFLGLQD